MDSIRNNSLAALLILSIVISITGTFFAVRSTQHMNNIFTGAQTAGGTAKVNITELVSVTFEDPSVDFGSGQRKNNVPVDVVCNITTNGSVPSCWNVTGTYSPHDFRIVNTGSVNINVSINSTPSADFFSTCNSSKTILGGTPAFSWASHPGDGIENGCVSGYDESWTGFSGSPQMACSNLTFTDSSDSMNISLRLDVPAGPSGVCSNEVTLTAARNY